MSSRLLPCLLAGALAASLAANLYLAMPKPAPLGPELGANCAWLEELGLSDTQIEQLKQCCQSDCCSERVDLAGRARSVRTSLRQALEQPVVDGARVRALAAELADIQSSCVTSTVDAILMVRNILEPEQVTKLLSRCRMEAGE